MKTWPNQVAELTLDAPNTMLRIDSKIEQRDLRVIGISAFGGFLLMFIPGLIAKDVATALLVGLLMGVPSGAGGGVLGCLLRRHAEPSRKMTSTERRRGALIALTCGVVLLLAWALAFVFSLTLKQSFAASCRTLFSAIWGLTFLNFLGSWLYGRCVRGLILLDCGPLPMRWLFVVNSIFFVFVGFGIAPRITSAPAWFSLARLLFASSFSVYWLIVALGRLQVTEHGIWTYCSLLRWRKLGSYRWADDSTLLVTAPGLFPFFSGAVRVPPGHRQAVDALLTQHCGVRHVAEPGARPNERERGEAN